MLRFFIFLTCINTCSCLLAQTGNYISGILVDGQTHQPLNGASISIYRKGMISGTISNTEGNFSFNDHLVDSVKFSMIGYHTIIYSKTLLKNNEPLLVQMKTSLLSMEEVVIKPMTPMEIVTAAITHTLAMLPADDFENKIFYREIIRDRGNYFSVAEAIFKTQYFIKDKSFKLAMDKGRSKEDVSYTRLFEDYHPGGGPEALADKYPVANLPDFFNLKKTKWFSYRKNGVTEYDGKKIWVISFDQQPEVKESLDKGTLYIDAADFSLLKYEAVNSPLGMAYVKNLTGTDKIFASLLNIDFKRNGWKKEADFIQRNGKLFLSHAYAEYFIDYKQPKKQVDLDLTIISELLATEPVLPLVKTIAKGEEWKRKNIVANLPTDFDANFWGAENIISPTRQIEDIISGISKKNKEDTLQKISNDWLYHNGNMFVAYSQQDSFLLIPIMKGSWEDDENAGMLFKEMKGDIMVEAKLSITKRSDPAILPDNGFQQSGLIIRSAKTGEENNILLCVGTAGNPNPKILLRKTENGKSKGPVDKIDGMSGWLRLVKKGAAISAFYKTSGTDEWKEITTYNINWGEDNLQVGLMVMARFAGSGPKMKPDMKATFTHVSIINQ